MTHVLALIESYQEQLSEEIKRSEKFNRKMRFSLLCSAENTKQSKPVALKYHTNPTWELDPSGMVQVLLQWAHWWEDKIVPTLMISPTCNYIDVGEFSFDGFTLWWNLVAPFKKLKFESSWACNEKLKGLSYWPWFTNGTFLTTCLKNVTGAALKVKV